MTSNQPSVGRSFAIPNVLLKREQWALNALSEGLRIHPSFLPSEQRSKGPTSRRRRAV